MKLRLTLPVKILLLALTNVLLIAGAVLLVLQVQLGSSVESLFLRASEDRIASIAQAAALEFQAAEPSARDTILQRFRDTYGADFYLFRNDGKQLAGTGILLPGSVLRSLSGPPPGRLGPPPPPPGRPPPGRPPRNALFYEKAGDPPRYWVGIRIPIGQDGSEPGMRATLFVVAGSLWQTPLFVDFRPFLLAAALAVGATLLCWVPFLRRMTRSIRHLTEATGKIAEGRFQVGLREQRRDELGQLSLAIQRMADRLALLVNGQKRFLGDVAHELCSPIARMQFALGILERKVEAEAIDDLREEVQQISGLVEELLQFSKASLQPANRPMTAVNVAQITRQAAAREGANVEIRVDDSLTALADPEKLQRAVGNLVRNAVRYAGADGPIMVSAAGSDGHVHLQVSDHGPGLPEDELEKVLAPFYRPELSRTRAGGGAGLGLAIVKACVEACQGTVRCRNRLPRGLEVEIVLAAAGDPR